MPSRSKYRTNASEPRQDSSGNRVPSTNRGCSSDASGHSGRAPIPSCMWNASTSRHRCKSSAPRGSTAASRCPQRLRLAARPSRVVRHKSSRRKGRVTDENNCCPQAVRRGAVLVGFARAEWVCWRPVLPVWLGFPPGQVVVGRRRLSGSLRPRHSPVHPGHSGKRSSRGRAW